MKRVCGLLFGLCVPVSSAWATAGSDVDITQTVVDINGGTVEIGDVLDIDIAIENISTNILTNAHFEQVIPPGSEYQANSATVDGVGNETMVIGNEFKKIDYDLGTMNPSQVINISYQTQVVDSPLYFVESSQNPSRIFNLNTSTGEATLVSPVTGESGVYGLALTSDARYLYGVNSNNDTTWRYDLVTDEKINLGPLNLGQNVGVPCLDFTDDDRLIGADSKKDFLFEIDTTTGQAEFITYLEVDIRGGDCAFGSDGDMYVMSNTNAGKGALWVADPVTGLSKEVADVSDTEFFTGLALGTSGDLYGSGNNTDRLYGINATTGLGTAIGSFGISHGGGDLAMAAGQKISLNFRSEYGDDQGNEVVEEEEVTHVAEPPPVGENEDIRDQAPVILPEGPMCVPDTGTLICELPSTFATRMQLYVNDVVEHHFRKVEDHIGDELGVRELEGDQASNYMDSVYDMVYSPDRAAAQTSAEAMVSNWITLYEGAAGPCPHEYVLMKQIRNDLTVRQAEAMLSVGRYDDTAPPKCALALEETLIRYGDEIAVGWDTYGGNILDISPYIGGTSLDGMTRIRPLETTTFTLSLYDNNGPLVNCSDTVIVEPACDIGFTTDVINSGDGTYLMWNAEGSDEARILPTALTTSVIGQMSVFPTETTTYTLQGLRDGQVLKECSRTITVLPAGEQCTAP